MANEDDEVEDEGAEPQEQASADGCVVLPAQCEIAPAEREAPPEGSDFLPGEELAEQFPVEPIPIVIDKDGLPRPVDTLLSFAPPFTHEHVVCIEDRRKYVELFSEELYSRGWWMETKEVEEDGVRREGHYEHCPASAGRNRCRRGLPVRFVARSRFDEAGAEEERKAFDPLDVVRVWGAEAVAVGDGVLRPVRPIRERCKHYARQCFNNDEQPDPTAPGHRIHFSHCLVRRSVGGAFMSLRDQAIYACDHRDPPHPESTKVHLDAFDERRLGERGHETLVPLFGLAGDDVKAEDEHDGGW